MHVPGDPPDPGPTTPHPMPAADGVRHGSRRTELRLALRAARYAAYAPLLAVCVWGVWRFRPTHAAVLLVASWLAIAATLWNVERARRERGARTWPFGTLLATFLAVGWLWLHGLLRS